VQAAIAEARSELGSESLYARGQAFGPSGIREMVQSHASIVTEPISPTVTGVLALAAAHVIEPGRIGSLKQI